MKQKYRQIISEFWVAFPLTNVHKYGIIDIVKKEKGVFEVSANYEYTIKKEQEQVKIRTSALFDRNGKLVFRITNVEYLPARARAWRSASKDAEYKAQIACSRGEEKQEWYRKAFLAHCTEDDMKEAIKAHYEAMMPNLNEIIIRG